jgi:DNA helicase-2/ATP-dependent DNA helicase PcrA
MANIEKFEEEYNKLNKAQRVAVDTIDGPVMVVAGPGTGKTQVLALRIANILSKTDTKGDGILCLTFTNAGVRAMRERLFSYIGASATKIKIATFHNFAMGVVEEFFPVINFSKLPSILDDTASVSLIDEILENGEWEHLRPRASAGMFFNDIKNLISLSVSLMCSGTYSCFVGLNISCFT